MDDSNQIPCEPRLVLQAVCEQCHTSPPLNGAPFPLVTRTDVLTMRPGGIARDLMVAQLNAHRMPLLPVTITDAERTTLLTWLQNGAPATAPQTCVPVADAGPDADDAAADAGAKDADADVFEAGGDADASEDAPTD